MKISKAQSRFGRTARAFLLGALLLILSVRSFAEHDTFQQNLEKYVLVGPGSDVLYGFQRDGSTVYTTNLPDRQESRGYTVWCRGEIIATVEARSEGVDDEDSRPPFYEWNEICAKRRAGED